jgi:CheY-like chemotaxis protein
VRRAIILNVKIAVVDHEQLTREFIVNVMMYSVNRKILSFERAEEVQNLIQTGNKIDIILSDVHLPGIGGIELLKFVKEQSPNTLFIAMSANPGDEDAAVQSAADAFLAKPFSLQELFNIVQHFIVEGHT